MVLVIDNYDSFTYNLVQYLGEIAVDKDIEVYRNDKLDIAQIRKMNPEQIIISPGPGHPKTAGISNQIIARLKTEFPILGVCLGHQCIGQQLGASIVRADNIYHGKTSRIFHREGEKCSLFKGLENPFLATRYHSLIIAPESLTPELEKVAWTENGEIMALKHRELPLFGVQFHPESILTSGGKTLLNNFLECQQPKEVK